MAKTTSGKSSNAFRTISEVAVELDLPQHVLRFWETKFPQIKPMKRGGGRRYYRPEDVQTLVHIRDLLHKEGYTIKGAQNHLKQGGNFNLESATKPPVDAISDSKLVGSERQTLPTNPALQDQLMSILEELEDIRSLLQPSQ